MKNKSEQFEAVQFAKFLVTTELEALVKDEEDRDILGAVIDLFNSVSIIYAMRFCTIEQAEEALLAVHSKIASRNKR